MRRPRLDVPGIPVHLTQRGVNRAATFLGNDDFEAYLHAMKQIVLPTLRDYRPEMIIVASGLDANAVDPLARQMLHSGSFRELTRLVTELADELCDGKVVAVHDGGYAESAVPFCGLAVVETLAGLRTEVVDPFEEIFVAQQPTERVVAYQKAIVEEIATGLRS